VCGAMWGVAVGIIAGRRRGDARFDEVVVLRRPRGDGGQAFTEYRKCVHGPRRRRGPRTLHWNVATGLHEDNSRLWPRGCGDAETAASSTIPKLCAGQSKAGALVLVRATRAAIVKLVQHVVKRKDSGPMLRRRTQVVVGDLESPHRNHSGGGGAHRCVSPDSALGKQLGRC